MGALIGEVVNLRAAAVGAVSAVLPADGPEMVDAHLLVGEGLHHLHQAVELLDHGRIPSMQRTYPVTRVGSSRYISATSLE